MKKYAKRIIPTLLLALGVIAALWFFVQDNTRRISAQNEEYIGELTLQRAISIDSLISENKNYITSTAYLYGQSLTAPWADVEAIRSYEANTAFEHLRFVDASGDDYTSNGVMANLADRDYFLAGMRGESGIVFVPASRVTGERQIGFYAPVRYGEEIIGVMVGFYGEDYIRKLLEYDLFGQAGEGWLCARDGTVLGATTDDEHDNLFTCLAEEGKCDQTELSRLQAAFVKGQNTAFTYHEGGESATGYVVALSQAPWVLIRSFPPSASAQILRNANSEGMALVAWLVVLFAVYGIYLGVGVIFNRRQEREANRNANDVSTGVTKLFEKFITIDLNSGEYSYIFGMPDDTDLPQRGRFEAYRASLLRRIPEDEERREAADFVSLAYLRENLTLSDRASIRVHAPIGRGEWFTYNFVVIERQSGMPTRLLVVSQDVTELHRREENEQRRLQEALTAAEQASRAKTEFLFNMSHDLRTPMNAIIGYIRLAQQEECTAQDTRDFVRKIDASSQHLLSLINDILEMSRIESGKLTLEAEPTNLLRVMDETREMFAEQMTQKRIAFTVDTAGVRHRSVICDAHRLDRILLNLVSNACKFTPEGGQVTVTLAETDSDAASAAYCLRVQDTGIGMSPDFVARLFTPFERERTSTVSKTQGTGLGLSITREIVNLMGGEITVQTAQGEGTTFVVTLRFPLAAEEEMPSPEQADSAAPDFAGRRLLLVEDNEINREIATMILTQAGFVIDTAENGQLAVDRVAEANPGTYDAVLMDIQMPVLDGYGAARAIRALPDADRAGVPIVAMTANAFQEDIQAALAAGMNAHIAKPLDVERMLSTLAQVLKL